MSALFEQTGFEEIRIADDIVRGVVGLLGDENAYDTLREAGRSRSSRC